MENIHGNMHVFVLSCIKVTRKHENGLQSHLPTADCMTLLFGECCVYMYST